MDDELPLVILLFLHDELEANDIIEVLVLELESVLIIIERDEEEVLVQFE